MAIRLALRDGKLLRVKVLDLINGEPVDDARVKLIHRLPLDDLVSQLRQRATSAEAAAAGRSPDLSQLDRSVEPIVTLDSGVITHSQASLLSLFAVMDTLQ